jgi:hypothetical protein
MSDDPRTPAEIEQDHAEEDVADEIYRDDATARHCEIRIDGLPDQLPAGRYAVTFSGMEYQPAGRPVIRFRYEGVLNDDATVKAGPNEVYRTKTGKIITEAMIDGWVAEAERGYDIPDLYQVSTTEVVNVSKLARVIAALLARGVIGESDLGAPVPVSMDPKRAAADIEGWLRA